MSHLSLKAGLYRIWCGVNRLGDSGVHTLGDTSAFVYPAGQILLTRRGKTRMNGVGIVFSPSSIIERECIYRLYSFSILLFQIFIIM